MPVPGVELLLFRGRLDNNQCKAYRLRNEVSVRLVFRAVLRIRVLLRVRRVVNRT